MLMTFDRFPRVKPSRLLGARSLGLALLASGLMGCVAEMPSPPANDRFLVEPIRLTHSVTFVQGESELVEAEQYDLAMFLDDVDPDGRADIYLDASGPDKAERVGAVAATLTALGRQSAGSGGGQGNEHGVTVTLLQDVILPEACLDRDGWPQPHLPPASCTQSLTLVRMVEDQDDLLRGRKMGPALSQTSASAAARYLQKREPAQAEEQPASSDLEAPQQLPPSPLTREANY